MSRIFLLFLISFIFVLAACTDSSDDSSFPPEDDRATDGGSNTGGGRNISTDCGIVVGGSLTNPTSSNSGIAGTATIGGPNRVQFTSRQGDRILVKLHGIDDFEGTTRQAAITRLSNFIQGEVIFFPANTNCSTSDGGGQAQVGQIVKGNRSASEDLISSGLVRRVDTNDECAGSLLGSCYQALLEVSEQSGDPVSNFLWKPVAERDDKLVILFSPSASTVIVNGENCVNNGPSNGRATTARCSKTGCAYGANAKVSAFDREGRPLLFQGQREFNIPNGCNRLEF